MKYMGSKNRLAKHIVPIIQDYIDKNNITKYIEPFVGGANVIDKIKCNKKIGCDIHKELIHLLRYVQDEDNWDGILSNNISKNKYDLVREDSKKPLNDRKHPLWYMGLVGFCASYNGKYFNGYSGIRQTKGGERNYTLESINNLRKQSLQENFKDIRFKHIPFQKIPVDKLKDCVVYCDPPYRGTTKYKTEKFPYDEFYEWCVNLSKNNIVLISEYDMPTDRFECIWEKEHSTHMNQKTEKKIERLFKVKQK